MTDKEIKTLEQSAQKGDKKAAAQLNELGVDYQFGNNGKKVDLAQALHYYTIAAEGGNTNAMCNAAYCYAVGSGTDVNAEKALYWYKKAAEAGDMNGMTNLGGCYLNGFGTKQDSVEAIIWFAKALDAGNSGLRDTLETLFASLSPADSERLKQSKDSLAQYKLAEFCLDNQAYDDAISWYMQSAKGGKSKAIIWMTKLGLDFLHGENGQFKNPSVAFRFFNGAAECGYQDARSLVAYCILRGNGTKKDVKKAIELYKELADEGYEKAIVNLGLLYYYGEDVGKDIAQSTSWFLRAAEEFENISAMNYLSHIYGDTEGFINYSKALKWFSILVDKDSDSTSEWYHKTRYDKVLCQKIYRLFENAISESQTPYRLQDRLDAPDTNRSLFPEPVYFCLDESRDYLLPLVMESDSWSKTPPKERKQSTKLQELDPMLELVAQWVVEQQEASTSKIQRVFEIGYDRAGKLMSQLEMAGIVGPNKGSKGRDILITDSDKLRNLLILFETARFLSITNNCNYESDDGEKHR